MDVLKLLLLLPFLFSCSKTSYLVNQMGGQLSLQWNAERNHILLEDKDFPEKFKEKIRKIETYKKHFYDYWDRESTRIYSKTTMLKSKAVTNLVISSNFNQVKANKECFPIFGCFPYLGFFHESDAKEYAKVLEEQGKYIYIRPVLAYSTLGYFQDTILSSFFYYSDFELAEVIFHELFHTIFFIKDEVDLNENLANFIGKRMALDYFKVSEVEEAEIEALAEKKSKLAQKVVDLAEKYSKFLKKEDPRSKQESDQMLEKFMADKFLPQIESKCGELGLVGKECFARSKKWNNASLAAFLTYESKGDEIKSLYKTKGSSLKKFYAFIEKKYEEYGNSDKLGSFSTFLFKKGL